MATDQKYDYLLKYITIGSPNVGKSKIVERFVKDTFNNDYYVTIGVEFGEKNIEVEKKKLRIQINYKNLL